MISSIYTAKENTRFRKRNAENSKRNIYIKQTEQAINNQEQMLEQKNQDGVNID